MISAATKSVDETRALAAEMAPLAVAGDLILLAGGLGSGKTAFAQGFGRGLGVIEPVTSPTFIIMRGYQGRIPLFHLDVYRLDQMQELIDLGLSEMLDEGGVALMEWGDRVEPALPTDFLEVRIEMGESDDDRVLRMRAVGPRWPARLGALRTALGRWLIDE